MYAYTLSAAKPELTCCQCGDYTDTYTQTEAIFGLTAALHYSAAEPPLGLLVTHIITTFFGLKVSL